MGFPGGSELYHTRRVNQLAIDHLSTKSDRAEWLAEAKELLRGLEAEAEALLTHSLALLERHFGAHHAVTINAKNSLAAVLIETGKLDVRYIEIAAPADEPVVDEPGRNIVRHRGPELEVVVGRGCGAFVHRFDSDKW